MKAPKDADARRAIAPVICYPNDTLYKPPLETYRAARAKASETNSITIPPREARCFYVTAGSFFRISCPEGAQVGDLNLFEARNLDEHFYSGKTRALHGSHIKVGDRLWSCLPYLRPMATVLTDTLDWYGVDEHGGRVHDVIGTRCDPYTHHLLTGKDYHHTCHSNLTRALADHLDKPLSEAEALVHDVLNVFMCTGFTQDTGQYFMKSSPARKGDYIEFFAEIDLLCALSACPGGDCGSEHSSDAAQCHPLEVTVHAPPAGALDGWYSPSHNRYSRRHSHD
ncbi:urea carboxylase-associated family protein [Roseinatronobacter sp.]|uniref:urea carboxylase-associated family protein n=1 Tax=Roseinatronobacter sp. TaxID=1945755 RepID=UPI003F70805F